MLTMLMETTYEAILDTGYHPSYFEGTNTGVFVGACLSETEELHFFGKEVSQSSAVLGYITSSFLSLNGSYMKCYFLVQEHSFDVGQSFKLLVEIKRTIVRH